MGKMNREILFRAKRIDNGTWIDGYLLRYSPIFEELTYILPIGSVCTSDVEVDTETVCQYTGLTDKNGKKIFEGDIVRDLGIYLAHKTYAEKGLPGEEDYEKYRKSAKIGIVSFCTEDVCSCGCCFPRFEGSGFKVDDISLLECEVIGNIFDNPELLGGDDV